MILVTGANGFVGREVCRQFMQAGIPVTAAWRGIGLPPDPASRVIRIASIGPDEDFRTPLEGCSAVVHLAARVHVIRGDAAGELDEYRRTNLGGSVNLARQAAECGVRRFVYLSTAKVLGEQGDLGASCQAEPSPEDAYSLSKLEAEHELKRISAESGLQLVILRPPLVYGPGVKANFLNLMRAIDQGWPLPLGAVRNRRSMIYVGNLANAIVKCVEHPAAAGRTYLISDGDDLSTPDLVRRLARELGRRPRLPAVPVSWLRFAARLLGRSGEMDRLAGSLYFDAKDICRDLGWMPPYGLDAAICETARWYRCGNR